MRELARSRDVVAGAAIAVFGVVYIVSALQIRPDPSAASVLGPRVAPLVIGSLMVVCALVLVAQGVRSRNDPPREPVEAGPAEDEPPAPEPRARRRVLVTFGLLAAYIVAFIPVGFVISTIGYLVAQTTYFDRDKLLRNSIFGLVFAPVVYLLFTSGLGVQLPPGLLPVPAP